jgi:hypothetical protein
MGKTTCVVFYNVIGTGIILWKDQTQTRLTEHEDQVHRQVRQIFRLMPSNVWLMFTCTKEIMNFRTKRSGVIIFLSHHFAWGDRNLVRCGKDAETQTSEQF